MRVGIYARVSTYDQQTLPLQLDAMYAYVANRGWRACKPLKTLARELRTARSALPSSTRPGGGKST